MRLIKDILGEGDFSVDDGVNLGRILALGVCIVAMLILSVFRERENPRPAFRAAAPVLREDATSRHAPLTSPLPPPLSPVAEQ